MQVYDSLTLGILWDRLVSICDEVYQAFLKSSFSPVVREAYDAVFVLFDDKARLLAQASSGPPSFIGTSPNTIRELLKKFPPNQLSPGDAIATNDPWIGTGQINDLSMIRPIFQDERLVGYTGTVQHLPDIGGAHTMSGIASEIYEEGLRIPPRKLVNKGTIDKDLLELIQSNVRIPEQVIGDIKAGLTANALGERLTLEFMREHKLDNMKELAEAVITKSEEVTRRRISEIPPGDYKNEIKAEGYGEKDSITIACTVKISSGEITVDYEGTSRYVQKGLNVPFVYTGSYTRYALKCAINPELPNNEGSTEPIKVLAPATCILNAPPPTATSARHIIGWFVPMAVWGALSKALPKRVIAESGMPAMATFIGKNHEGKQFVLPIGPTIIGGSGARPENDGEIMSMPTNIARVPIEIWEKGAGNTLTVDRCEIATDSGGPGKYRGGPSVESAIVSLSHDPIAVALTGSRTRYAAQGYFGGHPGRLHETWINKKRLFAKGIYELNEGDILKIVTASGGGMFKPEKRDIEKVLEDYRNGYVSKDAARRIYKVKIEPTRLRAYRPGSRQMKPRRAPARPSKRLQ